MVGMPPSLLTMVVYTAQVSPAEPFPVTWMCTLISSLQICWGLRRHERAAAPSKISLFHRCYSNPGHLIDWDVVFFLDRDT